MRSLGGVSEGPRNWEVSLIQNLFSFPQNVERGNYSDKISNYSVCLGKKKRGHLSICISLCILKEFSAIILDTISYNPFS